MNVIRQYPEGMDKKTAYRLMNSNAAKKMLAAEGSQLEIAAWVVYEDVDESTGEIKKVLSLSTTDGEIFGTISPTFIREFEKMADYFGDDLTDITVISGKSKSGRTYITCDIA